MNKRVAYLGMVGTVVVAACLGCGGGSKSMTTIEENSDQGKAVSMPVEYVQNYEQDTTAIYGKGTALSGDLQMSVDEASLVASGDLATRYKAKLELEMQRVATKDATPDQQTAFGNRIHGLVSETLIGTEEYYRNVFSEAGKYRAYVVIKLPVGSVNKVLRDDIAKNAEQWKHFMTEKQWKEFQKNIAKYEASKQ